MREDWKSISMEELERSRLEEMAEEVMQKEQRAQRQELEDIANAGYTFEGTRLEVVANEVFASFLTTIIPHRRIQSYFATLNLVSTLLV